MRPSMAVVGVYLLFLLFSLFDRIDASHFAFGTISWQQKPENSGKYTIDFLSAFRTSYPWPEFRGTGDSPGVGDVLQVGTIWFVPTSSAGEEGGNLKGQYSGSSNPSGYYTKLTMKVTAKVVYSDDWFSASSSLQVTLPSNKYIYLWDDCCRIETLTDGNGADYAERITGKILPNFQFSPTTTAFPRAYFVVNKQARFTFPITVNNPGATISSVTESDTQQSLMGYKFINGNKCGRRETCGFWTGCKSSYDSDCTFATNTGTLTWTPKIEGQFAFQVKIAESTGVYIVLDLLFQVLKECTGNCNNPPVINAPAEYFFYRGAYGIMSVIATDADAQDNIDLSSTVLPDGASFVQVSYAKQRTVYELRWTPNLDSVGKSVCFNAIDSRGQPSLSNTCTNLKIGTGEILQITGTLRDFKLDTSKGFGVDPSQFKNGNANYLKQALGSDGRPEFSPNTGSDVSAAMFNQWFTSTEGVNIPQAFTMLASNAPTAGGLDKHTSNRVFRFREDAFYPIDNLLYGNEGLSNNRYFTYEVHTYFTYIKGTYLQFQTTDDLFVFIDGSLPPSWQLWGLSTGTTGTAQRSQKVDLDSVIGRLNNGTVVKMDIYFAHRSKVNRPSLLVDITPAPQCNSFSSGKTEFTFTSFPSATDVKVLGKAKVSNNVLSLNSGAASDSGAVWYGKGGAPQPFKLQYGFQATFTFSWSGASEGFAFVIQNDGPSARGAEGSHLGYGGASGISNSIAIEFDGVSSAEQSDPTYNHISIHWSGVDTKNTASEANRVNVAIGQSLGTILMNFANQSDHTVRVEYLPAQEDSATATGWLRVYLNQIQTPVVEAVINPLQLDRMLKGAAYVGFTSGTSDANKGDIFIKNWKLILVPVDPSRSYALTPPYNLKAGDKGLVVVQLKDVCDNRIKSGSDSKSFQITLTHAEGKTPVVTLTGDQANIIDNSDGSYQIPYNPTVVGQYSMNIKFMTTAGTYQDIRGSPFQFRVFPGITDPTKSDFAFEPSSAQIAVNGSVSKTYAVFGKIIITARDKFGNLNPSGNDPWQLTVFPDLKAPINAPLSNPPPALDTYIYTTILMSPASGKYTLSITLNDQLLKGTPKDFEVKADLADAVKSSAQGTGLGSAIAGDTAQFILNLKDKNGNVINSRNPEDVTCNTVNDGCVLTHKTKTNVAPVKFACQFNGPTFECSYTATVAGEYSIVAMINRAAMESLKNTIVTIVPGAVSAPDCVGVIDSTKAQLKAGQLISGVYIQARDRFSNDIIDNLPTGYSFELSNPDPAITSFTNPLPFAGQGKFPLQFIYKTAKTLDLVIVLKQPSGSQNIKNNPFQVTIVPNDPSTRSTLELTQAQAVAGQPFTLNLVSIDAFENKRVAGGDENAFLTSLVRGSSNSLSATIVTAATSPVSEKYTVTVTETIAATYTVRSVVKSSGSAITFATNSLQSITVIPAATSGPNCVVFGDGVSGGTEAADSATVSIQAKDAFNNNQIHGNDKFTVRITKVNDLNSVISTVQVGATQYKTGGLYEFVYKIPTRTAAGGDLFDIVIYLDPSTTNPFFKASAQIFDSTTQFYYSLHRADDPTKTIQSTDTFGVSVPNSFIIRELVSNGSPKSTTSPWSVTLRGSEAKYTITSTSQKPSPSTGASDTLVTFTPFYQLPVGNSPSVLLTVIVSRGSATVTPMRNNAAIPPQAITIVAGPVTALRLSTTDSDASITAGSAISFTLLAMDAFQNVNNSNAVIPTLQLLGPEPRSNIAPSSTTPTVNGWTFNVPGTQVKQAAQWQAQASAPIGGSSNAVDFAVTAGAAKTATLSDANPSGGQQSFIRVSAGNPVTFTVTILDEFGNTLSDDAAKAVVFDPALSSNGNSAPAVTITRTYSGLSSFAFSFTVNRVSTYSLSLGLSSSITVNPSNPQVIVDNGDIDASKTTSTILTQYVAGTVLSFDLSLFDSFNNPFLPPNGDAFTASYQKKGYKEDSLELLSEYSLPLSDVSIRHKANGVYSITIDGSSTKQAGDYLFSVSYLGNPLTINPSVVKTSVIASVMSVPRTLYPSSIPNGQVGVPFSFNVILRDEFSNPIRTAQSTLSWNQLPFSSHASCESTGGDSDFLFQPNPSFVLTPDAFDQSAFTQVWVPETSSYRVTVTPLQTGPWTIVPQPCPFNTASCSNLTMYCNALIRLKTRITPGPADASESFVYWTPQTQSITAGETLSLVVVLRDKYRNWIDTEAPKDKAVVMGEFTSPVTGLPSDIKPEFFVKALPYNPNDAASEKVRDNKNSTLFIRAQPTKVGRWAVLVALGDKLIGGCVNNAPDPQSRLTLAALGQNDCTIQVSASDPFTWKLVDRNSIDNQELPKKGNGLKPVASVPFTIFLQVSDNYGNSITRSVNYTYSIIGKNDVITAYTFDGVLNCPAGSPICSWTFVSFWHGTSDVSIKLLPGPHPICVEKSQGQPQENRKDTPYRCLDGSCQDSIERCDIRPLADSVSLDIQHVTCAAIDETKPFRCPDRSCVASPNACKEFSTFCPTGQVRCAVDDKCVANAFECPCPAGFSKTRSISGACIKENQADIPSPDCPTDTTACPYVKVCRKDSKDCPTPPTCPPGYFACADTTCVRSPSNCSDYTSKPSLWGDCASGLFRCLDGSCHSSLDNCPSRKTCPSNQVLCPDSSCQDSAATCPEVYSCANPLYPSTTSFRCADGSCKDKPDSCSSQVTCPLTMVLCDNGQCALSRDSCLAPQNCSASLVRCPDGTCANNLFLCPSKKTCPVGKPVLCPDGSCNAINTLCTAPRFCPEGSRVCADGSCAVNNVPCPTTTTCRADEPVLCSDGTCAANRTACRDIQSCPPQTPFRCPDGSCRVNILDCPSRAACDNPRAPIRCMDGHCVESSDRCVSADLLACPLGQYRCPGGECTTALSLCPTQVTCPLGGQRCNDGSCRASCKNAVAPECDDSAPVRCPTPVGGLVCVATLSQCPQFQVCPINLPVRCMDATCASSVSDCPNLPNTGTISLVPCPDGSWSQSASSCPTPVSCPVGYFKCFDNTCRKAPEDCPQATACPKKGEFRCPNGACAANPWDTNCTTNTGSCVATPSRPVRCPGDTSKCPPEDPDCRCQADIKQCYKIDEALNQCPSSALMRCRDGSCREETVCSQYTGMKCSAALPFLCPIGVCVSSADKCLMTNSQGVNCPQDRPLNCRNGTCVADTARDCGIDPSNACPTGQILCGNGVCGTQEYCASSANKCLFRCYDGTCALPDTPANSGIPLPPPYDKNPCINGAPSSSDGIPNACPAFLPIKCSNGLCANTYLNCSSIPPSSGKCKPNAPFECANGDCVLSSEQCRVVLPTCPKHRCADGQCVDSPLLCRFILREPDCGGRAKCSGTGLCSPTASESDCIDPSTGCPVGYAQVRKTACKDVAGLSDQPSLCIPASTTDCSPYAKPAKTNGCPSNAPVKCWDGSCVAAESSCRALNGCPADRSFLCEKDKSCAKDSSGCPTVTPSVPPSSFLCANGTRVLRLTDCVAANGCPITSPVRCADGQCKKYPALPFLPSGVLSSDVCPSAVGCPSPLEMCYDNTCVADLRLCASAKTCPLDAPYRCIDGSCVAGGLSNCKVANGAQCPPKTPVICPNGLCAQSLTGCPSAPSIGTSTGTSDGSTIVNGGTGSVNSVNGSALNGPKPVDAGDVDPSPPISKCTGRADAPVLCFDGSCQANFGVCLKRAGELNGVSSNNNQLSDSDMNKVCSNGDVACADGQCVPKEFMASMCGIIPACGLTTPYRCHDGSCVSSQEACGTPVRCEFPGYTPATRGRCEDGSCRVKCLPYDGCPVWLPYQCNNRECAATVDECNEAAIGKRWEYNPNRIPPRPPGTGSSRRLLSMAEAHAMGDAPRFGFVALATDDSTTADNTNPNAGTTGTSTTACHYNCRSQVKAGGSFMIDTNRNNELVIAEANAVEQSWLFIPAGALKSSQSNTATIIVNPVSDSRIRAAENRVIINRRSEFGGSYLTMVRSVVSPVFDIRLNGDQALSVNLTLRSSIDMNTKVNSDADRCLAKLIEIYPDTIGYAAWQCTGTAIHPNGTAIHVFEQSINESGVYAFIIAPVKLPEPASELSWAARNAVYIALGLIGLLIVILAVLYFMKRLHRYRAKLHNERAVMQKQVEEVEEMEQFGGSAGQKDDEVEMMSNPMVLQMKDMQRMLDIKDNEMKQAELAQRQQESAVRHEHINQLKSDRDNLQQELERLRAQLQQQQRAPQRPVAVEVPRPAPIAYGNNNVNNNYNMGYNTDGSTYQDTTFNASPMPGAMPEQGAAARTEFQARGPKKARAIE